jgi:aldehyde dehydrogenase (NAD+)
VAPFRQDGYPHRIRHEPAAPFGGFKQSGIGREYGTFGLEAFLEPQAVLAA